MSWCGLVKTSWRRRKFLAFAAFIRAESHEAMLARKKRWRDRNREFLRAYNREYRRAWRAKNLERERAKQRDRMRAWRARKKMRAA